MEEKLSGTTSSSLPLHTRHVLDIAAASSGKKQIVYAGISLQKFESFCGCYPVSGMYCRKNYPKRYITSVNLLTFLKGPDKSPKAINTSEDLLLLLRIYRAQGKDDEAFLFLESVMKSSIEQGKENWELTRQLIELASLTERWRNLWNFCLSILQDARQALREPSNRSTRWGRLGDDWKAWEGLVKAGSRIGSPK